MEGERPAATFLLLADHAIRVHLPHGDPLGAADVVAAAQIPGVEDVLPAAETVLVTVTDGADLHAVRRRLAALDLATPPAADVARDEVVVRVRYDGPDLAVVAELLHVSAEALVREHTATTWRCAFVGFAPGFGYLRSDRARPPVPRRDVARPRIPAGSVAVADRFSAVYPRASPGGWQLLGSSDAVLWDLEQPEPALVRAGTTVRFVDVSGS